MTKSKLCITPSGKLIENFGIWIMVNGVVIGSVIQTPQATIISTGLTPIRLDGFQTKL